jgi:hypothetical protein
VYTMRWSRPLAAVAAIAILNFSAAAADRDRPFGEPPPQRNTEERPFGGPPPNSRAIKSPKSGLKCKTATGVCALDKALPVGTVCTCPEGSTKGAQGKVE